MEETLAPTTAGSMEATTVSTSSQDGENWAVRPIIVAFATFLIVMILNVWWGKKKEKRRSQYAANKKNYVELTPTAENYMNDFDLA